MPAFGYKEITSNSCSDIACREFLDCFRRVESVTSLSCFVRGLKCQNVGGDG